MAPYSVAACGGHIDLVYLDRDLGLCGPVQTRFEVGGDVGGVHLAGSDHWIAGLPCFRGESDSIAGASFAWPVGVVSAGATDHQRCG